MTKDSNGNALQDGDNVMVIRDLKVKGGTDLKRGKVFKGIRLSEDADDAVEVREGRGTLVLKTMYLKKT
ncbi:PhnA domain-containing protein [Deinococcus sp. A31D244]|uniref:PhnA domain-containing protein n=1 Tax=Deinococcus sp. A31D244 TaxID=3397675 RepID=UPI0039E04B46